MKNHETKKSFEKSQKKIGSFAFLLILLNQAFYLPILLTYGIVTLQLNTYFVNGSLEGWEIVYFLFIIISMLTFMELVIFFCFFIFTYIFFNTLKYYIIRKKSRELKCFFCEKNAKMGFFSVGLPSFYRIFGIPICEQHRKVVIEDRNTFLIEGQRIYKRYTFLIRWVNVLIIVFGIISISIIIFFYNSNGLLIIIILISILFPMQLILYFYLCVRMFIKIRNGIEMA